MANSDNDRRLLVRSAGNPILQPRDVPPSREDFVVECLLNPGAFCYRGRVGLLLRVAERPVQAPGWIATAIHDPDTEGGIRILRFRRDDPDVQASDSRVFSYRGQAQLTTLSHFRLAWSSDGEHFRAELRPAVMGRGPYETFGVEDCRITELQGRYFLTYTAVSQMGAAVGMSSTTDWKVFESPRVILPPHNKDCAIFPRRVNGSYWALHRPSGVGIGGNNMWLSRSPDLVHWGEHTCLATVRPGKWDAERIGAGPAPLETAAGWLHIYHGADTHSRYCLGAMLLDLENPTRVLARSETPILEPDAAYELDGFLVPNAANCLACGFGQFTTEQRLEQRVQRRLLFCVS